MNDNTEIWIANIIPLLISLIVTFVITEMLLVEMINGNFDYWIKVIVKLTILSALSGIVINYLGLDQFGRYITSYERMAGFFGNPNELGFIINMAIIFLLVSINKKFRLINVLLLAIIAIASFLTYSKGAIITTIAIGLIYLIIFSFQTTKTGNKIYIILTFSILVLFLNSIFSSADSNLTIEQNRRIYQVIDIFSGNITDEATSGRLGIFESGLSKIKENPFIGHGLGSFGLLENTTHGIHNAFLLTLGESGIFPFLFLVYMFLFFLVTAWINKFENNKRFLMISMLVVIIVYMMGTHGVFVTKFFLLFVSLLAIYSEDSLINIQLKKLRIK